MPASDVPGSTGNTSDSGFGRSLVRLEAWAKDDFPLLERLNAPEMMDHLGGPESPAKLADRQRRYELLAAGGTDRMFKIILTATGAAVGSVGFWERIWRGEPIYELGWSVLPAYQGRGIASRATTQALALAQADGAHRFAHAFPGIDNPASNALCRKLGFTLIGPCDFEYPPGSIMRCNDWQLDLVALTR